MNPLTKNQLIRASAGTGKTYQLSSRYLQLLAAQTSPQEILATTFTRKAAGEILDRVFERLAKSVLSEDFANETARSIEYESGAGTDFFGLQLQRLLNSLNLLQISTLDAFFAQLARAFAIELGLRQDWRMIDEAQQSLIITDSIRETLQHVDAREIIFLLNKGETDIRIGELVRTTIDQLHETYLEAPESAWLRVEVQPVDDTVIQLIIDELLQLADQCTDKRITSRLKNDVELLRTQNWPEIVGHTLTQNVLNGTNRYYNKMLDDKILQIYQQILVYSRSKLLVQLAMQNRGALQLLKIYDQAYQRMEMATGGLTFASVNRRVAQLFSKLTPDDVNQRLDQNIKHLLLDEFQDTSLSQWQVLKPFAVTAIGAQENGSLFCVGDTKQAIYGWRGGVAEIFDEVQTYLDEASELAELTESRRSSKVIIDTVNQVFLNMHLVPHSEEASEFIASWQRRFTLHSTHYPELPGFATLQEQPEDSLISLRAYAAGRIAELANQHPGRSIGVLVRTNAVVNELAIHLGRLGIRASEEGGNYLLDSAAVNLIYSLLHLIDHPGDEVARFHVTHSRLGEILELSPARYENERLNKQHDVRDGRMDADSIDDFCQQARTLIGEIGLARAIEKWSEQLMDQCTLRERTRLLQLVDMAFGHVDHNEPLATFRRQLETYRVDDPLQADVRVMTIHQAKGLEFDIVVLPQLDCPLIRPGGGFVVGRESPTKPISSVCKFVNKQQRPLLSAELLQAYTQQYEQEVNGELCLLYVAMTRAIHALHLIVSNGQKPSQKKWQGLILGTLVSDQNDGEYLWSAGNSNWDADSRAARESSDIDALISTNPNRDRQYVRQIELADLSTGVRMLPVGSPSRREGGQQIELGSLLRSSENSVAMKFGSLIHACFESITWLEAGIPQDSLLLERLAEVEGATQEHVEAAIRQFKNYVQQPNIGRLLSQNTYSIEVPIPKGFADRSGMYRVENERPFAIRQDESILQGFIDRLVLLEQDQTVLVADVIDFKTDSLRPGDQRAEQQRVDWYRPQLEAYRFAVSKIFRLELEFVTTHLVFVATDRVVKVH